MAMAGKRPTLKERQMLLRAGKDPNHWLRIKATGNEIQFRHRIQESKKITLEK